MKMFDYTHVFSNLWVAYDTRTVATLHFMVGGRMNGLGREKCLCWLWINEWDKHVHLH